MTQASLTIDAFFEAPDGPEIERRRLAGRRRRSLVVTDESARHPFRASLPPHVTFVAEEDGEEAESLWHFTRDDMRGFASVYVATFFAVLAFII